MSTKRISVRWLLEEVNRMNRESTCAPDVREGWNTALEMVLRESNNYSGFGYLVQSEVPEGHQPGMTANVFGEGFSFFDETRKHYYYHENLKSDDGYVRRNANLQSGFVK